MKLKQFTISELQNTFFSGLLVLIPIFITIWIISFILKLLDGTLGGIIYPILGKQIWGLGAILAILFIFIIGFFAKYFVGNSILKYFENIFARLPLVKNIYTSSKQVVNAISKGGGQNSFKQVVMIEYPRKGIYTIGFLTKEKTTGIIAEGKDLSNNLCSIFIPTTPNPTSGFFIMVPRNEVQYLDMSVEDGVKIIMSAGLITPGTKDQPKKINKKRFFN